MSKLSIKFLDPEEDSKIKTIVGLVPEPFDKQIQIKEFPLTFDHLLYKTIVLYGMTSSGKSFIIRNILYNLKNYVHNCIVFCPTECSKDSFYSNIIDPGFIFKHLGNVDYDDGLSEADKKEVVDKQLHSIIDWQMQRSKIEDKVNQQYEFIKSMYDKYCCKDPKNIKFIEKVEKRMDKAESPFQRELLKEELLYRHVKNHVYKYKDMIFRKEKDLSTLQINVINKCNLNSNLLIIFDDAANELYTYQKLSSLNELFTQGRHGKITTIITCQNDKDLPPKMRKNTRIKIFTSVDVATSGFNSKSDGFPPLIQKSVGSIIDKVFSVKYRKLFYLVENDASERFFHYIAKTVPDFKMKLPKKIKRFLDSNRIEEEKLLEDSDDT